MTRDQALDTLARCAVESNEAMAVLKATHPLRPLGVTEAELKRRNYGRCPGCGVWAALEDRTTCLSCEQAEYVQVEGDGLGLPPLGVVANSLTAAAASSTCAECGVELMPHEAARRNAGKFTECCDECVRLKLGLA